MTCNGGELEIPALCTERDLPELPHLGELPGCAPFVRGGEALQAGFATPVHVPDPSELDALTKDTPLARSVLHLGPSFATEAALERLFDLARRRGVDARHLRATIECDPLGGLVAGRIGPADLAPRLAAAAALLRAIGQKAPLVRGLLVRTRWLQHRGASLVLESAGALCAGIELIRRLELLGLAPDLVAPHVAFRFAVTTRVPDEIARLRIVRGLWAKVVKAFGVLHKSALQMHLEAETSEVTSTSRDPHLNLVRSALQTFAAAAAGCETLTVLPFDARAQRWSELATRLAQNQQRLLEHEAHLDRTADPAGGAYAIEVLSDRLGRAIWAELQRIEAEGGLVASLGGPLSARLDAALEQRRQAISTGAEVLVGVNKFAPAADSPDAPHAQALWHAEDAARPVAEARP